jgi:hypothetical protein
VTRAARAAATTVTALDTRPPIFGMSPTIDGADVPSHRKQLFRLDLRRGMPAARSGSRQPITGELTMNKRIETKKTDNKNTNAIESIETTTLDAVTGGCSRCGCGQPDQVSVQQQFAASWMRR